MNSVLLNIHLIAAVTGVRLAVLFGALLRNRILKDSPTFQQLFRSGAAYPYNRFKSLRLKYFLPWVELPNLSPYGSSTEKLFILSRWCSWFSALAVLSMVWSGFVYVRNNDRLVWTPGTTRHVS